jgi:hypothetical protein
VPISPGPLTFGAAQALAGTAIAVAPASSTQGAYNDLPSLDDAQGAAQPKAPTFEVTHAFTVAAGSVAWFAFYLDVAVALHDITAVVSANAAGKAGESVTVYAQAA